MNKVFVVQMPHYWDNRHEKFLPKFNIKTAEVFGQIQYLLSPKAAPFNPESIILELQEKLKDFCDEDYILMIGNPALIAFAGAIAAARNEGRVRLLQWSGREGGYIPIQAGGLN